MPAKRSRTLQWRRCLEQIHERNGAIEIAVDRESDEEAGRSDLIWRVRVLALSDHEIVIEQPMTLGQPIRLGDGIALVAIMAVGQNRWMFRTVVQTSSSFQLSGRKICALRLSMPEEVDRCQRRDFYRVRTAALSLPEVEIWPLLDPKSVVLAERAAELRFERHMLSAAPPEALEDEQELMPEVGPRFGATLLNLGGGGIGLNIAPEHGQIFNRHKLFWIRFPLPPVLTTPICATAKVAHTHLQADQYLYAGMSFDFSFNTGHQRFVVDQICRYLAIQQRLQLQRASTEQRRTA